MNNERNAVVSSDYNIYFERLWAVLWHPLGAIKVQQLGSVLEDGRLKMQQRAPNGFLLIDVAATFEEAQQKEREWKRAKRGFVKEAGRRAINGAGEALAAPDLVSEQQEAAYEGPTE